MHNTHCCGFTLLWRIFPLQHESHHNSVTNLCILNNEMAMTLSSLSIKPQALHGDSRERAGRLVFSFAIYRNHSWCMNKGMSSFPCLLLNSFYTLQFVGFSTQGMELGGGTHNWRRDRKSPREKKWLHIKKTLGKKVPWILASEIFDDNIWKVLILSRILRHHSLAVL